MVFVLTQENAFFQRFHFKFNRNNTDSSKNGTRDFQNSPPFERSACFYVAITGCFERFQYFNIETNFLTMKLLSQKIRFLVENTKIENASFPQKTAYSEDNVKPNRMRNTAGLITKKGILPVTTFLFEKIVSV